MSDPDVCIVGAGAGGAVAAWALTMQGVRVTLLDAGPRFDPNRYRTHSQNWELDTSPFEADASEERSWESAPSGPLDTAYAHLASRSPAMPDTSPTERGAFVYSRALGVGGSTLH